MSTGHARRGMALVAVIAVVSLIAILAVATLSVTTRLNEGSAIAARDARLDAAASYAWATALIEWRQRGFAALPVGSTQQTDVTVAGSQATTTVTVTRLNAESFWIVSEAAAVDGSRRRHNVVARWHLPRTDTIPAMSAGSDVRLSRWFNVVPDTNPGCVPSSADLRIGPAAALSSADGSLPSISIQRVATASDSVRLFAIGSLSATALAVSADVVLPAGISTATPSGVAHAAGDLTLTGGVGQGVLIVDGRLTLTGAASYSGIVIARGGVVTAEPGSEITGLVRAGPVVTGVNSMDFGGPFTIHPSACAAAAALRTAIGPRPVSGRWWTEIY